MNPRTTELLIRAYTMLADIHDIAAAEANTGIMRRLHQGMAAKARRAAETYSLARRATP